MGSVLGSVLGKDYENDVLNFASFDVEQFAGVTGKLSFVLNTTSAQSATVFIPEGFSSVTPVSEPETFAMLFAGLAVLGVTVHRNLPLNIGLTRQYSGCLLVLPWMRDRT